MAAATDRRSRVSQVKNETEASGHSHGDQLAETVRCHIFPNAGPMALPTASASATVPRDISNAFGLLMGPPCGKPDALLLNLSGADLRSGSLPRRIAASGGKLRHY